MTTLTSQRAHAETYRPKVRYPTTLASILPGRVHDSVYLTFVLLEIRIEVPTI